MKIAQVVSTFPPYHGGTGNAVFCISESLTKLGHEVTVFTPEYNVILNEVKDLSRMRAPTSGEILRSAQNDGLFKVVRLKPVIKIGNAAWVPQLLWKLRGFDVVHLHAPFIGAEQVLKRKFIFGGKLVATYHHDLIGSGWHGVLFAFWNKCILPWYFWMSDKLIGSSLDYIADSNAGGYYKSHPEKFVGIPFGVDTEKFFPSSGKSAALLTQFGFLADEKIILFVGGLDAAHNFKGVRHLINAAKILHSQGKRFRVLIVGDGDLRPGFERQVNDLGLKHVVKFFGGGRDILPALYNLACVEVLPSTTKGEAFGLVLLEAMACGKPVVASNLPGVRTVCEDNVNGLLVKSGDETDLAEKLGRILSDENLARRLGDAGLHKVREKYNWEKVGEMHEEIYRSL